MSKTYEDQSKPKPLRCLFKQHSIASTLSVPLRLPPAWGRVLRFKINTKFKSGDFFQVMLKQIFAFLLKISFVRYLILKDRKFQVHVEVTMLPGALKLI